MDGQLNGGRDNCYYWIMLWLEQAEKYGADPDRVQVWDALSRFYLDSEIDQKELEHIAEILACTPFSIEELQDIERHEVQPVCLPNLFIIPGGEWGLFQPDWLIQNCLKRMNSRPNAFQKLVRKLLGMVFRSNVDIARINAIRSEKLDE
jgi:hypothetical protein